MKEPVMRKLVIATTAAVVAFAAVAQQPQQCVNPDLLNGLVFLGRSDQKVTVTRGLPAFMSGFRAPTGFSLIGTGVRGADTTVVAYKTSLPTDKAYTAVLAVLGADGWAVESTPGSAATFNVAGGLKEGTVCRNAERRTVLAADFAGVTYVNIFSFPGARPRDCNAPLGLDLSSAMGPGASPRFQFPAGTSLAQGFGGGGGGSNSQFTTSTRIISGETAARLVEHLASQMASQGWRPDASWFGRGSAGSTWSKTDAGGLNWGMLEIIRVGEGTYDVDFTQSLSQ
jgi:hypothetical protein